MTGFSSSDISASLDWSHPLGHALFPHHLPFDTPNDTGARDNIMAEVDLTFHLRIENMNH